MASWTAEELAWAEAHGIDMDREVRTAHDAGVRIAACLIDQARQRRLRAIDRAIGRGSDRLSDLHRRGQRAAVRARRERREHQVSVARTEDGLRWQPVCGCGWAGQPTPTLAAAERVAREEQARIFRPLSEAVEHTDATARSEVA